MKMQRAAPTLAYVASILLLATAAFHLSATGAASAQIAGHLKPLFTTLWIFFGAAMAVAALLVAAMAPVAMQRRGLVLAIASLLPLVAAALMQGYLGFLAPVVLLILDGALVIASAAMGKSGVGA
ncbi:MAG TPA: hypothetical protein VGH80_10565 [Xanthomonadaceae bacterium]|jgi:hypothetical protein